MRAIRTGTPTIKEVWDVSDIMNHLKCDEMKAKKLFDDYHAENGGGYGKVEKALMLDYIERKQREEREREARYQSDLSNVESIAILKEQVKTLKEQVVVLRESSASSSKDAQKARIASYVSNAIAIASLIVAVISILLKVA